MARPNLESIMHALESNNILTKENTYSFHSSPSLNSSKLKDVTLNNGREIICNIVDKIFDRKIGMIQISSSSCSIDDNFKNSEHMDKRLKVWQDTLRDREKMQRKISEKTGRRPSEMLFNLPITIEQREKGTVQRLMDYAKRMSPEMLQMKTAAVLPENFNKEQCICIGQLQETLPKAEQLGKTQVEISGLTRATKRELLGDTTNSKRADFNTKWLNSKVLGDCIEANKKDIMNVLEYFPDTEKLEVVGKNILKVGNIEHDEDFDLVDHKSVYSITSSSKDEFLDEEEVGEECPRDQLLFMLEKPINVGIKINDEIFVHNYKRSSQLVDFNAYFECQPYQRQLQTVYCLENIGRRVISCNWVNMNRQHLQCINKSYLNDDFLFDVPQFLIFPGEMRLVNVVYQPRAAGIYKQHWELRIYPSVFCNRRDKLTLKLTGKCVPPPEYLRILNNNVQRLVDKSTKQVTDELAKHQAELAQLIHPTERTCPYERSLDEREIFNAQNAGYHCERFDDIESLKALYNSVKLPRQPQWDLTLSALKTAILQLPERDQREEYFETLINMLESMKCSVECEFNCLEHSLQRKRSCFVYVRGCIGNGIEEWEDLMISIEQTALKSELVRFYANLNNKSKKGWDDSSDEEKTKPWLQELKYSQPELYVLRNLRSKKYFMDSLYMHTYTQLCDMVENIVSIIESTDFI